MNLPSSTMEGPRLSKQERRNLNKMKRKAQDSNTPSATQIAPPKATTKRPGTAEGEPPHKKVKPASSLPVVANAPSSTNRVFKPASLWNFAVDYNDHFETPPVAYKDISPVLHALAAYAKKEPANLTIYDPYWCEGSMVSHLKNLGFANVINKNRDFYADIKAKCIPEYDILVTNPPYSGEHKVNLLKFLAAHTNKASTNVKTSTTTNTTSANTPIQASNSETAEVSTLPFALLLPVYVATKSYWKDFVQQQKSIGMDAFYILPPDYYEYSHPEGTGKDIPPFYSAWFLGGFAAGARERVIEALKTSPRRAGTNSAPALKKLSFSILTVAESIDALVARGVVTDSKRPNPKQRHKMKAKLK